MANPEHLKVLKQGVWAWNEWRKARAEARPNLQGADLANENLREADLVRANLIQANLTAADLTRARLSEADLTRANLSEADLTRAELWAACLDEANLSRADLFDARLAGASLTRTNLVAAILCTTDLNNVNLAGADLAQAVLGETTLANVDLSGARNLDGCDHRAPSIVDHRTLERSGTLPLVFLRGCGFPDDLIDNSSGLYSTPLQVHSCFISYSTSDGGIALRVHADLQDNGVRCWFAPEDMKIGERILDTLDRAIRVRDKVLLILSENSIKSEWVEDEVTAGLQEERKRGAKVLFPVRIDDAVMDSPEPWAAKLRNRHIGDFTQWKDHEAYQQAFERLLTDLRVEGKT